MSVLAVEKLSHNFHDKWLFQNITFGIQKGDRLALVGINGSGKSTLLRILAGRLAPQDGKVVGTRDLKIGYLEQEPDFSQVNTVEDYIYTLDNELNELVKQYNSLLASNTTDTPKLQELTDLMTVKEAWSYEEKLKIILNRLGINDLKQKVNSLSGGQKKRLSLAKLLIDEPDIYLLDEPTNHLDIETIEWLENLLTNGNKTVLLITHDRYFLENVCTEIRELYAGQLYSYKGNYSYFLEKKAERVEIEKSTYEKNNNLLRKELEWMRRQPQARATKSKSRIDAFYDLQEKTKINANNSTLDLSIKAARQGNKILEIEHITKTYSTKSIIKDFSYIFKKGDRIGLAGVNGSGKSTFLNLITRQVNPDTGKITIGDTTVYGYYKQEGISFDSEERVIDMVKNIAEYITMANGDVISASQLLTLFLFPPNKQFDLIANLSGGEKKRLQLLCILFKNPNFLILDEPTNDLDTDTLKVLEDFLSNYQGVLILVSHDRYLLDNLCDQLFIFKKGEPITIFNGNYTEYKNKVDDERKETKEIQRNRSKLSERTTVKSPVKKISFKEQREFELLEKEIEDIERLIAVKTEELNLTFNHLELTSIASELSLLNKKLNEKSDRWLVLSELI